MNVTGGSTNVTTYFVLRLAATGVEATGLTIANMDLQYVRTGTAPAAKVDATALAATDTAHTDNYGIEIDATDQPGLYRIDWPDAAFAAGVKQVILTVKCATAFTEHLAVDIDPPVNVTKISDDATAADNAELMFDGTGYAGGTTKLDVNAAAIASGAITATAIADNAIDLATFAADVKTGSALKANVETISANAITATAINADAITAAKIAAGAIDAATFAADVDAEVAGYVWDALRSAHTTADTFGDIDTTADIAAAVRDVSNASPAAGSLGETVNDILTDTGTTLPATLALAAQLPALGLTTGVIVDHASNSATTFSTNLAGGDNFWNNALILLTSGALAGQVKEIGDFADADGFVTLTSGQAFTAEPAADVTFTIINR